MKKWWLSAALVIATGAAAQSDDGWDDWETGGWDAEEEAAVPLYGFAELGLGTRLKGSPYHDRPTLGDARVRLETDGQVSSIQYTAKGDLLYDGVVEDWKAQARELSLGFSPLSYLDVKLGRQVLTWGTGDYVFLNDLFAKDWQAFFIGRDDEYLKAPQDALRLSGYFGWANIELAWTPEFTPDHYLNAERLSLFSPVAGSRIGEAQHFYAPEPDDDELALRVYRNLGSLELALYGYDGYTKSPMALTEPQAAEGPQPTFAPLRAWGASVRSPLGAGLINAEVAHHDSTGDPTGTSPRRPNSQWRGLLGYERELLPRLTGSLQLYLEHTQDHATLLNNSPYSEWEPEQNRTLMTTRLTWRDARDRVTLSLFGFYSPSDRDGHLRPALDYSFNDHLNLSTGFNLFFGEEAHTFFGQLEDNQNAYLRMRYSF